MSQRPDAKISTVIIDLAAVAVIVIMFTGGGSPTAPSTSSNVQSTPAAPNNHGHAH